MVSSEIELVKRAQLGDELAFNDLYDAYYARSLSIAFRFTNDYADAQDVVQEAFIQVHKSLPTLERPDYFYSWLNRILHSKSVDLFYRNRNQHAVDPNKLESLKIYEEKRRYMLPQDESDYNNEQEVLKMIIADMDEKYRIVLDLAYFKQMKLEEVAQFLNLPIGTVKTRCRRAKSDLKKRVKQFEQTENRRLCFNVDMVMPGVMTFSFSSIVGVLKQKGASFLAGNAVNTVCIASAITLTISGTVMAVQDYHKAQDALPAPAIKEKQPDSKEKQPLAQNQNVQSQGEEPLTERTFGPYEFQNQTIASTREAYYTCINWASTLDEMLTMEETQIQSIQPIYNELKAANDQFYQMLQQRGWEEAYIAVLQSKL